VAKLLRKGDLVVCAITTADYAALNDLAKVIEKAEARFVYMGGCLDYGNHPDTVIDENVTKNGFYADTRVKEFEDPLQSRGGVIIRPGFVYGKSWGNYASKWFDISNGVTIDGKKERMYGFIHIDDLGTEI
jgi:nucleoside-diphosphate-sugar epimerase